ncbi:MAG: HAD family hydrolase [Thermoguttaceae bacterium]|jgi:phosphoglycolate phosphatase|nr:HAD family hydrolase [Thermoguttaceae bacterium]
MIGCRAVLFDLDGTLLDTLADLADSANAVLQERGLPIHEQDAYRYYVGNGVKTLFQRALPEAVRSDELVEACAASFRDVYDRRWNIKTRPFEGVAELLDGLVERGIQIAVLSNKPHRFTQKCVAEYLSLWPLDPVLGQREGIPLKPDPAAALEVAGRLQIAPRAFLYLGDTGTDMLTARAAGMRPVGALWGFRPEEELRQAGADRLIRAPAEMLSLLDGL